MKIYKSEHFIVQGQNIGVFCNEHISKEEIHSHDFIEIVYVLSGSATQHINEFDYEVKRGDVIFINYGGKHSFEPHDNFKYINICFTPEKLSSSIITQDNALALLSLTAFDDICQGKNGGKLSFCAKERYEMEFLATAMFEEFEKKRFSYNQIIESYFSAFLAKMLRKTITNNTEETKAEWNKFFDYIENNLGEKLSLSALAQKSFYNPAYFSRKFKQCFGVSLSEYIRTKRIEHAMKLLKETSLPVHQIILQVGFTDRTAFYNLFIKHTGVTPNNYRKNVK